MTSFDDVISRSCSLVEIVASNILDPHHDHLTPSKRGGRKPDTHTVTVAGNVVGLVVVPAVAE